MLVVEQFASAALRVADYAALMRLGRIEMMGEPDDVDDYVSDAYMKART